MGKHSGFDIYWNMSKYGETKLVASDWSESKAAAKRRVESAFERIYRGEGTPLVVLAVDPDTGDVVAGKMEV